MIAVPFLLFQKRQSVIKTGKKDYFILGLAGGLGVTSTDVFLSVLPSMALVYGLEKESSFFLVSAYFIATAISCLFYPFLSNKFSHKNLFAGSIILFCVSTLALASSGMGGYVVVGRFSQGIACGILQPLVLSMIRRIDFSDKGRGFGVYSFASELFSSIIPFVGAMLFSVFSWKLPFVFMVVIALILGCLIWYKVEFYADSEFNEVDQKSIVHLLKIGKFFQYNIISFMMIGVGWGIVTILTFMLENHIDHSVYYGIYTFLYAIGSLFYAKLSDNGLKNLENVFPYILLAIGALMSLSLWLGSILGVVLGALIFGGISGLVYGMIMNAALSGISEHLTDQSVMIFTVSRLISSAIFPFVITRLYFLDQTVLWIVTTFCFMLMFVVLKPGIFGQSNSDLGIGESSP